eukprot:1839737-Pleurochrysis_carterae.AAC.2
MLFVVDSVQRWKADVLVCLIPRRERRAEAPECSDLRGSDGRRWLLPSPLLPGWPAAALPRPLGLSGTAAAPTSHTSLSVGGRTSSHISSRNSRGT